VIQKKHKPPGYWTEQLILSTLRTLNRDGVDCRPVALHKNYHGLLAAGKRIFGSSERMYAAAGINVEELGMSRKWTDNDVLDCIRAIQAHNKDMSYTAIQAIDPGLVTAARKRFGSWHEALHKAGINPEGHMRQKPNGYWTRERIISTIKELDDSGEDIRPSALTRNYAGLIDAARNIFSNSEEMYGEAGIEVSTIGMSKKWTKEKIIVELNDLYIAGEDIRIESLKKNHPSLYSAGRNKFQSSRKMYEAAGISPESIGFEEKSCHRYTKELLLQRLKQLDAEGADLTNKNLQKKYSGLYRARNQWFESDWQMFVEAGIDPTKYVKHKHNYWTKERVDNAIKEIFKEKKQLPVSFVNKQYSDLANAALNYYDSWSDACAANDIPENLYLAQARKNYWSQETIINEIIRMKNSGESLLTMDVRQHNPRLYTQAYKKFDGWFDAVEAAGISTQDLRKTVERGYWTREKIVEEIREHKEKFGDLSYSAVAKIRSDLLSAGANGFGSWRKAVIAAGYDYALVVKQHDPYSKEEILDYLRNLHEQGISLDTQSMKVVNKTLLNIASRRFGTYENAVEALGLDYSEIRKDWHTECYRGKVFELYTYEALLALGWNIKYQKHFVFEQNEAMERCIPDYYDLDSKIWIDAKLNSWNISVDKTIKKYLKNSRGIIIIYLQGKYREWPDERVTFVNIENYYDELKENGAEQLIHDFEKLKRGILRPELQTELEIFIEK